MDILYDFVTMLFIIVAMSNLGWRTSTEVSFESTPDISSLIQFECWEQVNYLDDYGYGFPISKDKFEHCCGRTENCVGALIYCISTPDTKQMISRSLVFLNTDPTKTNKFSLPAPDVIGNDHYESNAEMRVRGKGD